jgi:hypothetical protein
LTIQQEEDEEYEEEYEEGEDKTKEVDNTHT